MHRFEFKDLLSVGKCGPDAGPDGHEHRRNTCLVKRDFSNAHFSHEKSLIVTFKLKLLITNFVSHFAKTAFLWLF